MYSVMTETRPKRERPWRPSEELVERLAEIHFFRDPWGKPYSRKKIIENILYVLVTSNIEYQVRDDGEVFYRSPNAQQE